jgi:hypothetical protein
LRQDTLLGKNVYPHASNQLELDGRELEQDENVWQCHLQSLIGVPVEVIRSTLIEMDQWSDSGSAIHRWVA